ncbi:MAG: hypothetical protein PHS59_07460 [Paludibacter sp.]|nr:hypothetical protein [Paludibacter sp.]
MKNKLFVMLFVAPLLAFSQESGDTLMLNSTIQSHIFYDYNQQFIFKNQLSTPSLLNMNSFYKEKMFEQLLQLKSLKIPTFSINPKPIYNPTDNLYNTFNINDNSWISTSRILTNYYGLGGINAVSASYNLKIGESVILSGGIYGAKYNIYNDFNNSLGVNGNFKYVLSDRISLNIFGQYSGRPNYNMIPLMSPLYPQSNYGGSFEFKVNDKWGIITGAKREFDVLSRKWITEPFIMPIFYKH